MMCFGSCRTCSKLLDANWEGVPGGKLFEAFLMAMSSLLLVRATYAAGAEAVGGSGGRDQSWNSIHGIGAAGSQAAEAIGTEEGGWLGASSDSE